MTDEQNDAQHAAFDEISVRFMRAVKSHIGREAAVDTFQHLQQTLGKDWVGRVMFHLMADNHKFMDCLTLRLDVNNPATKKINAIKCVRALAGIGLGEAKTFVEDSMYKGTMKIALPEYAGLDALQRDRFIMEYVAELRACGYIAEAM